EVRKLVEQASERLELHERRRPVAAELDGAHPEAQVALADRLDLEERRQRHDREFHDTPSPFSGEPQAPAALTRTAPETAPPRTAAKRPTAAAPAPTSAASRRRAPAPALYSCPGLGGDRPAADGRGHQRRRARQGGSRPARGRPADNLLVHPRDPTPGEQGAGAADRPPAELATWPT